MTPGRVLVTGASGAIGSRLVDEMRRQQWHVRALVHRHPVDGADEVVTGSLEDSPGLLRAAAGADAVLHLAATTHARDPRTYMEVNVEGTVRLIEAARAAGARRFVYVSTRAIASDGGAYSVSKARAEEAVANSGLPYVIVRLPEIYGASAAEGIDRIIAQARSGRAITVVCGDSQVCPLHIDDVVAPLVAALTADVAIGRTYTLAGACLPLREFSREVADSLGSPSTIREIPTGIVALASYAARFLPLPLVPDQLRRLRAAKPGLSPEAAADLGFVASPLREGLQRLFAPPGSSPSPT